MSNGTESGVEDEASLKSNTLFSTPFGRNGLFRVVDGSPKGPYVHSPYKHPPPGFYPKDQLERKMPDRQPKASRLISKDNLPYTVCMVGVLIFMVIFASVGYLNTWKFAKYRDRQILYYDNYWYGCEQVNAGSQITFIMEATTRVTFFIWNENITKLPTTNMNGTLEDNITIEGNQYQYEMVHLKSGSLLSYNFNSSKNVEFFISDAENLQIWDNGYSYYYFYIHNESVNTGNGTDYHISTTDDYYLVWYNLQTMNTTVNISINFLAADVYNYSNTLFYATAVTSLTSTTVTIPDEGIWYFFIYFDPMNSPAASTMVFFDVTYILDPSGILPTTESWIFTIPIMIITIITTVFLSHKWWARRIELGRMRRGRSSSWWMRRSTSSQTARCCWWRPWTTRG